MTRADIAGGLLLAAFFGVGLWEGWSFQYGSEFAPGPGFAPVWLSTIGLSVAIVIAFAGWKGARRADGAPPAAAPAESEQSTRGGLLRVGATLLGLAVMLAIVPLIGFVPAAFAFLLVLTLAVQRLSWVAGTAVSVGTVVFIYSVFVHFLQVPIPAGPLGF